MKKIVLLSLALSACNAAQAEDEPTAAEDRAPPAALATRVEVARVTLSDARVTMRVPGEVIGSRDANLASSLGGFVERVLVREGEAVREGQVLARVDASVHGAGLARARAEVAAAERELERAERLGDAMSAAARARAEDAVTLSRAGLRELSLRARRATLRAPFSGTVAEVHVEVGEVLAPGAPAIRLVALDPIRVNLSMADRDVVAIEEGMAVQVVAGALGAPRAGSVAEIRQAADLDTRAFGVEVELPNADHAMLPGMIARVEITPSAARESVVIPQHVLVTRTDGNGVFLAVDGVARFRPVTLGEVVRDQVVIASGLEGDERIVVTGHRELVDGDALVVSREGVCCTEGRVVFEGDR